MGKAPIGEVAGNIAAPQRRASLLLSHRGFEQSVGFVICLNAIAIGVEQILGQNGHQNTIVMTVVHSAFLLVYINEFLDRLVVHGLACFNAPWVKFDVVLVLQGISAGWIIEPFVQTSGDALGVLVVLRIVKLLIQGKEFWMLVLDSLNSINVIVCILFLMLMLLYCSAFLPWR